MFWAGGVGAAVLAALEADGGAEFAEFVAVEFAPAAEGDAFEAERADADEGDPGELDVFGGSGGDDVGE